jgi:alcohol dehydrogenase YqhD (iron-dependent ADH family)
MKYEVGDVVAELSKDKTRVIAFYTVSSIRHTGIYTYKTTMLKKLDKSVHTTIINFGEGAIGIRLATKLERYLYEI